MPWPMGGLKPEPSRTRRRHPPAQTRNTARRRRPSAQNAPQHVGAFDPSGVDQRTEGCIERGTCKGRASQLLNLVCPSLRLCGTYWLSAAVCTRGSSYSKQYLLVVSFEVRRASGGMPRTQLSFTAIDATSARLCMMP
ncbi:hypothetical protein GY45DRAFT_1065078 [Cubamyces sp. BRFM 1775]|nr:hypothetical protein GY45DRAFT_1065078 [Cubamyces sp. BRFM 1775]